MKEGKQERTLDLLRDIGATYVVVDEPQGFKTSVPPVVAATSPDLAMIRFHGHNAENWEKRGISAAERFRYLYSEDELREWVGARARAGRRVEAAARADEQLLRGLRRAQRRAVRGPARELAQSVAGQAGRSASARTSVSRCSGARAATIR